MTICNMSIEAGARAGMVAPDQTTYDYLKGRPHAPQGADWDAAVAYWQTLATDDDAVLATFPVVGAVVHQREQPAAALVCGARARARVPLGHRRPVSRHRRWR